MTKSLLTGLAILLCMAGSLAKAGEHGVKPDVIIERDGQMLEYRSNDRTPESIYDLLEHVCEEVAEAGDIVTLTTHAKGGPLDQLTLTNVAELRGLGPDKSSIFMTNHYDVITNPMTMEVLKPAGGAFILPGEGDIVVKNIRLEVVPENVDEDGALCSWEAGTNGPCSAQFTDCELIGHDWGVLYDWGLYVNRSVTYTNCEMFGTRSVVSLMHSNATYQLNCQGCKFTVDGSKSRSLGATSDDHADNGGVYTPVIIRCGDGHLEDCEFSVTGWPTGTPYPWTSYGPVRMATMATDHFFSSSSTSTELEIVDCRVTHFDPGIATVVNDIDFRFGTATVNNDEAIARATGGTGTDGEVVFRP